MFEGTSADPDGYGFATQNVPGGSYRTIVATCVRIVGDEVNWGGTVATSTEASEEGQPIIGWAKDGAADMIGGWMNYPHSAPCAESALTWNGTGVVTAGYVVVYP